MLLSLRRVCMLALTLLLLVGCGPAAPGPDDGSGIPDVHPQTTSAPAVTAAPTTTVSAPGTTAAPAETTIPAPVTTAAPITASGKFSSETGSNLEIHLEWSVIGNTDKAVTVRAEAYITHYEIWVSARHGGKLIIGNSSQSFSTEAITYDGKKKQTVTLTSATVDIPLGADGTATVDISVSWPFIGTYSGIKIDNLTCGGTVRIGQPGTPAPTTTATPATTAAPAATTAPETTAAPATVETPLTELGEPVSIKSAVFVDRNASHFGSVTLIRNKTELARLLDAHPADCKNAACTAITAALSVYDDTYFAGKVLLLVPQGSRYPTATPVEIFAVRGDAGALYVHIRDIAASRTAEQLLSTRFYLQTVEIPADALTGRTINVVQHGAYYTDTGRYERDFLRDEGIVTAPTIRAYQPAAITP